MAKRKLTHHKPHQPLSTLPIPPSTPRPRTPPNSHRNSPSTPSTPRKRKNLPSQRLRGIKSSLPAILSLESISLRLKEQLKLPYTPDDWQLHLIRRMLQGYDSIFCAGTGYGKSLVFQALPILADPGKLVIVISPLQALERDQVESAQANGIDAIMINQDNSGMAEY